MQIYLISLSFFGVSLSLLKTGNVVPIRKNKIIIITLSLSSDIEKIFKKVMHKRVYQILTENNIMHNLQFGFGLHDLQFFFTDHS